MEIKNVFSVTERDLGLIEMHSALNLLNALLAEITVFCRLLGGGAECSDQLETEIFKLAERLRDSQNSTPALERVGEFSEMLRSTLRELKEEALRRFPGDTDRQAIEAQEENIEAVLEIFAVRAAELLARRSPEGEWREFTVDFLKRSLQQVLDVMQRLNTTSPPIVYDQGEHTPENHLFLFGSCRDDLEQITLPAVFQDVIRDLVANARKYTGAGGSYSVDICDDDSRIAISITDDGRGIPEGEVENTVKMGYRGTNVRNRRTFGGGFGLTKAYLTTRRHGGRFFIDSAPEAGTTIRIELPVAASRKRRSLVAEK